MTTLTLATKGVLEHLLKKERKTTQQIKPEIPYMLFQINPIT